LGNISFLWNGVKKGVVLKTADVERLNFIDVVIKKFIKITLVTVVRNK
jgi:hypothetical protein